jgi:hypothetical protein
VIVPTPPQQGHSDGKKFVMDDGGRAAAGYKGQTGDCVCRSIAIATGKPYQEVYDALWSEIREHGTTRRDYVAKRINRSGGDPRYTRLFARRHAVRIRVFQPGGAAKRWPPWLTVWLWGAKGKR